MQLDLSVGDGSDCSTWSYLGWREIELRVHPLTACHTMYNELLAVVRLATDSIVPSFVLLSKPLSS